MKKNILELKDPNKFKKYINNKIPLKNKIISRIIIFCFFSMFWLIIWLISYINPKTNTISITLMLPLALLAALLFTILVEIIGHIKKRVNFMKEIIFYFSAGIGQRIKYADIESYTILKVSDKSIEYKILILKYLLRNKQRYLHIEIEDVNALKNIKKIFDDHNISNDVSINNSKYVQKRIMRYIEDSNFA